MYMFQIIFYNLAFLGCLMIIHLHFRVRHEIKNSSLEVPHMLIGLIYWASLQVKKVNLVVALEGSKLLI